MSRSRSPNSFAMANGHTLASTSEVDDREIRGGADGRRPLRNISHECPNGNLPPRAEFSGRSNNDRPSRPVMPNLMANAVRPSNQRAHVIPPQTQRRSAAASHFSQSSGARQTFSIPLASSGAVEGDYRGKLLRTFKEDEKDFCRELCWYTGRPLNDNDIAALIRKRSLRRIQYSMSFIQFRKANYYVPFTFAIVCCSALSLFFVTAAAASIFKHLPFKIAFMIFIGVYSMHRSRQNGRLLALMKEACFCPEAYGDNQQPSHIRLQSDHLHSSEIYFRNAAHQSHWQADLPLSLVLVFEALVIVLISSSSGPALSRSFTSLWKGTRSSLAFFLLSILADLILRTLVHLSSSKLVTGSPISTVWKGQAVTFGVYWQKAFLIFGILVYFGTLIHDVPALQTPNAAIAYAFATVVIFLLWTYVTEDGELKMGPAVYWI